MVEERPFAEDLEVALSGGGFRATAFTLGVLLYLAHSGLNRRVRTITSVSGGSITNGFVASRCDFSTLADVDSFRVVAARLAQVISGTGRYRGFWLVSRPYLAFLLICGVAIAAWFIDIAVVLLASVLWSVQLRLVSRQEFLLLLVTGLAWGVAALLRGEVVLCWISRSFFQNRSIELASLRDRGVDHVFCATDLTSSIPFFFSTKGGGRVFSEKYGRGDAGNVPLKIAVATSAAFPPFIPPFRLTLEGRRFTSGEEIPRFIWLSDGGVWNNLATDWSRLRSAALTAENMWITRTQPDPIKAITESTENCPMGGVLLMANASKPEEPKNLWILKIPVVSFVTTLTRVLSVTVNSTVAARSIDIERLARTRMLNDPDRWELNAPRPEHTIWGEGIGTNPPLAVLIEMTRSPGETARSYKMVGGLLQWVHEPDHYAKELQRPLTELAPLLEGKGIVPTTFDNIGRRDTLRLIVLGYLNARETLSVAFANHKPAPIPSRDWFEDLLGDKVYTGNARCRGSRLGG